MIGLNAIFLLKNVAQQKQKFALFFAKKLHKCFAHGNPYSLSFVVKAKLNSIGGRPPMTPEKLYRYSKLKKFAYNKIRLNI